MIDGMRWTLSELVEATGGSLSWEPGRGSGDPSRGTSGVSIDTRSLLSGQLFVAIRAERDGHDFVEAALAAGAQAVLVESGRFTAPAGSGVAVIEVADTAQALIAIGRAARSRLGGPVVGITGSVGKTSTKDLAAAAIGAAMTVAASPRSYNNELGLPLTLANAPDGCDVAVLEMGARGHGHIAKLCEVARPDVGVVTAVAKAHIEMLGDLDGVARAKSELVAALPSSGVAVLNADYERVKAMAAKTTARRLLYATTASPRADSNVDVLADNIRLDSELRPTFDLRSPWGSLEVNLETRGAHQVSNATAALSVAAVVGVDLAEAAEAVRTAHISAFRMEFHRTASGAVLINDSYNANPESMAAALAALRDLKAKRMAAILGPMAELGISSPAEHRAIAQLAKDLGVELLAVGTDEYGCDPLEDFSAIRNALGDGGSDLAILVKASRTAGLETVAARLTGEF
jgi:UDP-N-acetylmuramoyl-tripeptide--D-alanyl-D-alanine ligase